MSEQYDFTDDEPESEFMGDKDAVVFDEEVSQEEQILQESDFETEQQSDDISDFKPDNTDNDLEIEATLVEEDEFIVQPDLEIPVGAGLETFVDEDTPHLDLESDGTSFENDRISINNAIEKRDSVQQHIDANNATVIGQQYITATSKDTSDYKLAFIDLPPIEWRKVQRVFVSPLNYPEQLGEHLAPSTRIVIVQGVENSGKLACAVQIGLDLVQIEPDLVQIEPDLVQTEVPHIKLYRRDPHDRTTLLGFVQDERLEENELKTVYILKNAFEYNIRVEDLRDELTSIQKRLIDLDAYLILTTVMAISEFEDIGLLVVKTDIDVNKLGLVLNKHLDYYSTPGTSNSTIRLSNSKHVKELLSEFLEHLSSPSEIDQFCRRLQPLSSHLASLSHESGDLSQLKAEINKTAKAVSSIKYEDPFEWFNNIQLKPNAKLYAMLSVVFAELDSSVLNEIYESGVHYLRSQGVSNLIDPREIGLQEILDSIHTKVGETRSVSFNHDIFRQEVLRQVGNYHSLLWTLVEPLQLQLNELRSARHWQVRIIIGQAIGRIGIYNLEKLSPVLDNLAQSTYGGVAVVAGNALDQVCRSGTEHYDFVLNTLKRWIRSGHADQMWAAAAAIWRLYPGLTDAAKDSDAVLANKAQTALHDLNETLTQLAKSHNTFSESFFEESVKTLSNKNNSPDGTIRIGELRRYFSQKSNENGSAIVYSLSKIFIDNPKSAALLLRSWLEEKKQPNLNILGLITFHQLLEKYSKIPTNSSVERYITLLDVLPSFINTCMKVKGGSIFLEFVLGVLHEWITQLDPHWRDLVHVGLLKAVNTMTTSEHRIFRDILFDQWLGSNKDFVRRLARHLFFRTVLLDGAPVAPNPSRGCLIFLDESHAARRSNSSLEATTKLLHYLSPLTRVEIQALGTLQKISDPFERTRLDEQLDNDYGIPRIITPILETHNSEQYWCTILPVWGEILDFEDAWASDWQDSFVIVSAQTSIWPENTNVIRVPPQWWKSEMQFETRILLASLYSKLGQKIVQEPWEYGVVDNALDLKSTIETLATQVDSVEAFKQSTADVVYTIQQLVTWKAQENISELVEWLLEWLVTNQPQLQLIGQSGCKLIFTLYQRTIPSGETFSCVLNLLPILATQIDIVGFDLALQAIRYWIRDGFWLNQIQKPDGEHEPLLIQSVKLCQSVSQEKLVQTFRSWAKPMRELGETEINVEPVKEFVNRLLLRLEVGGNRLKPILPEKMKFGLLFVDNSQIGLRNANLFEIILKFWSLIKGRDDFSFIYPIIYRLGSQHPIALKEEELLRDQLVATELPALPRLAGPVLDLFDPDEIQFVIFFTQQNLQDEDDWCSEWKEKTFIYTNHVGSILSRCLKDSVIKQLINEENQVDKQAITRLLKTAGA